MPFFCPIYVYEYLTWWSHGNYFAEVIKLLGKQIGNQARRFYLWLRPLWPLHPWLEDSLRTFGISASESIWGVGLVGGCSETAFLIDERRCFCKMCKITSDLPVVPWEKGSTLPIGWLAHFPHQKMYHRATRFLLHACTNVMMYTGTHIECMHYTLQHTHTHLQMLHRVTAATIANLLTIDQPLSITISSALRLLRMFFVSNAEKIFVKTCLAIDCHAGWPMPCPDGGPETFINLCTRLHTRPSQCIHLLV